MPHKSDIAAVRAVRTACSTICRTSAMAAPCRSRSSRRLVSWLSVLHLVKYFAGALHEQPEGDASGAERDDQDLRDGVIQPG